MTREIVLNNNELALWGMTQAIVKQAQAGLIQSLSSQRELISLLETQHKAKYDPKTDKFTALEDIPEEVKQ